MDKSIINKIKKHFYRLRQGFLLQYILPLALCKDPHSVMTSSKMICDKCIWMRWKSSLSSESVIFPRIFAPFLETRWPPRCLYIPDKPFNVMEDVEGILHAARRMLDAMEPGPMPENVFVVLR